MTTILTFENLECWKKSREEVNLVYTYFGNIRDFSFRDQILRASISVMNNIAEGYGRWSNKEKIQFMNISNGSLFEVRSMLYVAVDQKYVSEDVFELLLNHNIETNKVLQGYMKFLHNKKSSS